MARRPDGEEARETVVSVRFDTALAAVMDKNRRDETRSEYIRRLVATHDGEEHG